MIRVGLIGAGPNGRGNLQRLAEQRDRCCVVAVADLNEGAAQGAAQPYGARAVTDFRAMLADVDAVVISSPNALHADQAVACAQAGKHVWVEKPMALSVADADRIVAAVRAANVRSFVGFSVRFEPAVRTIMQRFAEGRIGGLVSIWSRRMGWSDPVASRTTWRSRYEASGGLMSELMVHEIDWVVATAGMPRSVYCRKADRIHDHPRQNEHVWMTFGFEGEATGCIEGSTMSKVPIYDRGLVGATGALFTQEWGKHAALQTEKNEAHRLEPETRFDKHAHFLDVIEGRCESLCDVTWGRRVTLIAERALDSAVSGKVVRLEE